LVHQKLQLLLKKIGHGNFGEVWLADWNNEHCALKSLLDKSKETELKLEIETMSKLNHKNVIKFWGLCIINKTQYLIMEYMNGGDLRSYLLKVFEGEKNH